MPLPCDLKRFDVIDALRCPHCNALFERGQFVCYGAKPTSHPTDFAFDALLNSVRVSCSQSELETSGYPHHTKVFVSALLLRQSNEVNGRKGARP